MKSDVRHDNTAKIEPCYYGLSRIACRGPLRPTDGHYIACLGGTDTFGRFIPQPWPDLLEAELGEVCVNLGCPEAGADAFLHDSAIQALCHDAAATIIQVTGAANLSNQYYKVHPRRNDRFIRPTDALIQLYPEVDFTEISFTGHLLARLRTVDEERFAQVLDVLKSTWLCRFEAQIDAARGPVYLLWMSDRAPDDPSRNGHVSPSDPAFIHRPLLEALRPRVTDIIEVVRTPDGTDGMAFRPLDQIMAQHTLGPAVHMQAAQALAQAMRPPPFV